MVLIAGNSKAHAHGLAKNLMSILLSLIFLALTPGLSAEEFSSPKALSQSGSKQSLNFAYLNNEQLLERAQQLRSNAPNTTQQTLNYQWLKAHQNDDYILGKKVYQTLFKRGFKELWNRQRKERFKSEHVPDINGRGSVSNEVDYKLRLNSDELKVKFSYEF